MFVCKTCSKEFAKNPDQCDNCTTIVNPETFRIEHEYPKVTDEHVALKQASKHIVKSK